MGRRPVEKEARRSEVVTVRLDPKLRYLAELAARRQRRTLSSFIEWATSNALSAVAIDEDGHTVADRADILWDVDEPDRFVKLAFNYESLLTHEEQKIWKLIRENNDVWVGGEDGGTIEKTEKTIYLPALREHWEKFKAVAKGQASRATLPNERPF